MDKAVAEDTLPAVRARSEEAALDAGRVRSALGPAGWRPARAAVVAPVPDGPFRVVEIALGLVATASAGRILANGWVDRLWLEPEVLLGWPGLQPPLLPAGWLHAMVGLTGLFGLLTAAGRGPGRAGSRWWAGAWLVGFGYLELLDRTTYLNHYWAMTSLAVVLVLIPRSGRTVPAWAVWALRGQVAVVYAFAGVAKLDPDWLLRGEPLSTWLAARGDVPLLGPLVVLPGVGLVMSWAGLLFDLTIIGWLAWRRTRVMALVVVVAFHIATALLFPAIGVFPWLMTGLAAVWLDPATTARLAPLTGRASWGGVAAAPDGSGPAGPSRPGSTLPPTTAPRLGVTTAVLLAAWALLQIALPLRHLAIPGDVGWTEEGGRFAWRVMAEEKVGWAVFTVTADDGRPQQVALVDVLTPAQAHVAATRPDLLHQVAGALAVRGTLDGVRPQVTLDAVVAWNGRPHAPLVDPDADLAAVPLSAGHEPWILDPPP